MTPLGQPNEVRDARRAMPGSSSVKIPHAGHGLFCILTGAKRCLAGPYSGLRHDPAIVRPKRRVLLSAISDRQVSWLLVGLLAALAAPGCHHEEETHYTSVGEPPTVRLIQPQVRKIVRVVGQPSFVESYERSAVYPKMNAYIKKWNVDIGDKVKKDQPLATLFVPELVEVHGTRKATVLLDQERILLAKEVVEVASADVKAAAARLEEARAELASYRDAEVDTALGLGGQADRDRGRAWRRLSPGPPPGDQIGGRRASPRGTRRRRPS